MHDSPAEERPTPEEVLFVNGAGEGAYEADLDLAVSLQEALGPG